MSTDLTLFTHPVLGNLRTIVDGETIYICAKDAATALGFVTPLLHGSPYVIGADGALEFALDASKAQLATVTYKIVRRL